MIESPQTLAESGDRLPANQMDAVARRLLAGGHQNETSLLEWLDLRQQCDAMNRHATWVSFGGWLMLTTAALVSSGVAVFLARDVGKMLDELGLEYSNSVIVTYLPIGLVAAAAFLLFGGLYAWLVGKVPGLNATRSAIDWSTTCDAVSRLLSAGCTYPEAFLTARDVARTRTSRTWLQLSAKRIERGGAAIVITPLASGDSSILELLIDAGEGEPQGRWRIASRHFFTVAQQRLALLLGSVPFLTTIVSGLLVWLAISATLGSMWKAVTEMVRGVWW